MSDRLSDLVLGLQRMAEGARMRSQDLEYTQREERYELIHYLDQLLEMVEKLRASLLQDRKRLMPVEQQPQAIPQEKMPKVAALGPMPHVSNLATKEK